MITKICSTCKIEKPVESFFKYKVTRKDSSAIYRHDCKECAKIQAAANDKKRALPIKKFLEEYKKSCSCAHCGETDPIVFDFHHVDPSTKSFTISKAIRDGKKVETVKEELSKCICLCANCHRRLHYTKDSSILSNNIQDVGVVDPPNIAIRVQN